MYTCLHIPRMLGRYTNNQIGEFYAKAYFPKRYTSSLACALHFSEFSSACRCQNISNTRQYTCFTARQSKYPKNNIGYHVQINKNYSTKSLSWEHYLIASDEDTRHTLASDMLVFEDFLDVDEEKSLFEEIEPYMKKLRYEYDHWDNAIHGYRETERKTWSKKNEVILGRVKELAFPPTVGQLAYVHILDLAKDGCIKPHIDSDRFCGDTIAGLSLLSPSVMRLVHDKDKSRSADVLLKQRSLYIMKNKARYEYTHEVLGQDQSFFKDQAIIKNRRISVICRNEPS